MAFRAQRAESIRAISVPSRRMIASERPESGDRDAQDEPDWTSKPSWLALAESSGSGVADNAAKMAERKEISKWRIALCRKTNLTQLSRSDKDGFVPSP